MPVSRLCPGVRNPATRISGQSGCAGSMPPTMSCERTSLFTNNTRWPIAIVISSGVMPFGPIVIVGVDGGAGAGAGDGAGAGVLTGGDGDVGLADDPPEQAASVAVAIRNRAVRISASTWMPGRDRLLILPLTQRGNRIDRGG